MKKLLFLAVAVALSGSVFAEEDELTVERLWTPVQLNLASPLGLPWADRDVYGLRMNVFYGHSLDLVGADLGVVGVTRGSARGIQMNVYNHVEGFFRGVQFGPLANYTVKTAYGLQFAGILNWVLDDGIGAQFGLINMSGAYTGAQLGFLNWESGYVCGLNLGVINAAQVDFEGCAIGLVNFCKGTLHGCQFGVFNIASGHSEGLQFGVFNASEDHAGVQIGLLNLNCAAALPVMAVVNVNFR